MAETILIPEIIRKKRDGFALNRAEIQRFVHGVTSGEVTDAQIAALAMAAIFQDINIEERTELTLAMRDSGVVLNWDHFSLTGPVLDKHSTGGVGDTVSFVLAPVLAACGGFVPMIAGRGLAHTGGTIDKLESIPGYRTQMDPVQFQSVVKQTGFAIVGQTKELAPADRRMYATRDVTATVEQYGLITASILSKKLAAGLETLMMDIKVGSGAFMTELSAAKELADSLCQVGTAAGMPTRALITNMEEPLAECAGNALEVREAIDFLTMAKPSPRLKEVTWALAAEGLVLAQLCNNLDEAKKRIDEVHKSGKAAEILEKSFHAMGAAANVIHQFQSGSIKRAACIRPLFVPNSWRGQFVSKIDTRQLGLAIVALGGGRTFADQAINHSVGCEGWLRVGACCESARPLVTIHAENEADWQAAANRILNAYEVSENPVNPRGVIIDNLSIS